MYEEYEEVAQKDGETEVEEVAALDQEEVVEDENFTEGEEETEVAETSAEQGEVEETDNTKGDTAKNALEADKRRKREAKEAATRERIKAEAYRKGILDAVGKINPYTNEEIKDEHDFQEFLTMREIERNGGDPIEDYRSTLKSKERERTQKENTANARRAELEAFGEKYPDVDIDKLLGDQRFFRFAGKRLGNETLTDVYEDFVQFDTDFQARVDAKAETKAHNTLAKAKASPGSLSGSGEPTRLSYEDMSEEEFDKVLNRVLRGEQKI